MKLGMLSIMFKGRFIHRLLPVIISLALCPLAHAQLTFITNNGAINITGFNGVGSTIIIPNTTNGRTVTIIADDAFTDNTNVTTISVPNNVTNIGNLVFYSCTNLTAVTLGNQVASLGNDAFAYCYRLPGVTIPASVTTIGDFAFAGCTNIKSFTIPNTVTNLGEYEFNMCYGLTNITLGNNLPNIPAGTFAICSNLLNVVLPNTATNIGIQAFQLCVKLTNITIGTRVSSIGNYAFMDCASLASLALPASVTNLGSTVFNGCASLTAITVDPLNPAYSSLNGVLFNKAQTLLVQFPLGLGGSYRIPDGVNNIGTNAFLYAGALASITIPGSVTNIADFAFFSTTNLSRYYFLGNAPTLGAEPFSDDTATVYYLPGTTGWGAPGSTYGGLPTVLWNPTVQTDASFGIKTNRFGFNINWTSGQTLIVQACTNLANPIWTPVATNNFIGTSFYFSDPQWTNSPRRFYRLGSY